MIFVLNSIKQAAVQNPYPTRLPKVIASSVIRSAHQGESHGGVYLIDFATEKIDQVIDWNDSSINWEGRGADRGLRGIGFFDNCVYLAASDEIFIYDKHFNLKESFRNKYLKHCHEIFVFDGKLYLTSTGFDSVLEFDLVARRFVRGYCLRSDKTRNQLLFGIFDPNGDIGPTPGDTIHINNVHCIEDKLFVSSLAVNNLMFIRNDKLFSHAIIPSGTHNAQPFNQGVLLNDTASEKVTYQDITGKTIDTWPIIRYPEESLEKADLPQDHARQAFGRGLCTIGQDLIIAGSSPSTISIYRLGDPSLLKALNITMDIRNSIHGLEVWPF